MSAYQAFCIVWHLNRGDIGAARIVASLPPEFFAAFDAILEAAFAYGAATEMNRRT